MPLWTLAPGLAGVHTFHMSWRVVDDAFRTVREGAPPNCTVREFVDASEQHVEHRAVLLIAARRAEAYEFLADFDRDPSPENFCIAVEAMTRAVLGHGLDLGTPEEAYERLSPLFPRRPVNDRLLHMLAFAAAHQRHLGETLGQTLDRICDEDVALLWTHDVICDR